MYLYTVINIVTKIINGKIYITVKINISFNKHSDNKIINQFLIFRFTSIIHHQNLLYMVVLVSNQNTKIQHPKTFYSSNEN
jgi:hypothetical protein